MMARPSQKEKILAAAMVCFAEQGYAATRIRQIAERAGVSEGALYRHYAAKEAVAQALYAHHLGRFSELLKVVVHTNQPIRQRVEAVVRAILAAYRKDSVAFTFVLLQQPTFMPALPPETCYPLDLIEELIIAGQQVGAIRQGQPNLLAAMLLGSILRPIIVAQLAQPGALDLSSPDKHDQLLIEAIWAMLAVQ
jgi:AcrR family transcriptional regulator